MDDIWIIRWFNHTAFDANPIWKSTTIIAKTFSKQTYHLLVVSRCGFFRRFPNGVGIKCNVIKPAYNPYIIHI